MTPSPSSAATSNELSFQPVFIIGAARSGTKFLRSVLNSSHDVAAIPYDINYVWRHGNEDVPHDELSLQHLNPRIKQHIRSEIERLAFKAAGGPKPIVVEKTVSNTLRPDFVAAVFPEAKFIYLERDGKNVVESAIRQWTAPNDQGYLKDKLRYFPLREWRYALWFVKNMVSNRGGIPIWGPRYAGIEDDLERASVAEVCATQWQRSTDAWHRRANREHPTHELLYRELFDTPEIAIQQLCDFVGVSDRERVSNYLEENGSPVFNSWPGVVEPQDRKPVEAIISAAESSTDHLRPHS